MPFHQDLHSLTSPPTAFDINPQLRPAHSSMYLWQSHRENLSCLLPWELRTSLNPFGNIHQRWFFTLLSVLTDPGIRRMRGIRVGGEGASDWLDHVFGNLTTKICFLSNFVPHHLDIKCINVSTCEVRLNNMGWFSLTDWILTTDDLYNKTLFCSY